MQHHYADGRVGEKTARRNPLTGLNLVQQVLELLGEAEGVTESQSPYGAKPRATLVNKLVKDVWGEA